MNVEAVARMDGDLTLLCLTRPVYCSRPIVVERRLGKVVDMWAGDRGAGEAEGG